MAHSTPMQSLLLLPGLACDADVWRDLLPMLAPPHRVRVLDVHTRFDTLPEMAAALLAENPGRHVLVGASMGGMLALQAQRLAPERVVGLALLGTSARADTPDLLRLRTEAIGLFQQGRLDEVLQANLLFAFHPDSLQRPALKERYLAAVRRAGAVQLIRQNRAVMARIDSRPLLPAVACPTLVMCGDADRLTPPEHAAELAEGIPGAQQVRVAAAGHMLTMEQPEAVGAPLLAWLRHLPPP